MTELKITSWNCSGLRAITDSTAHKMGFYDKEMPNASFDISVFVETHHRGKMIFLTQLISIRQHTHYYTHQPLTMKHMLELLS